MEHFAKINHRLGACLKRGPYTSKWEVWKGWRGEQGRKQASPGPRHQLLLFIFRERRKNNNKERAPQPVERQIRERARRGGARGVGASGAWHRGKGPERHLSVCFKFSTSSSSLARTTCTPFGIAEANNRNRNERMYLCMEYDYIEYMGAPVLYSMFMCVSCICMCVICISKAFRCDESSVGLARGKDARGWPRRLSVTVTAIFGRNKVSPPV